MLGGVRWGSWQPGLLWCQSPGDEYASPPAPMLKPLKIYVKGTIKPSKLLHKYSYTKEDF